MDSFLKAFLCEPIHKIKVTWYMHHQRPYCKAIDFMKQLKYVIFDAF